MKKTIQLVTSALVILMLVGIAVGYSYASTGFKAPWFANDDGSFNSSNPAASETDPRWSTNYTGAYAKGGAGGVLGLTSDGYISTYPNLIERQTFWQATASGSPIQFVDMNGTRVIMDFTPTGLCSDCYVTRIRNASTGNLEQVMTGTGGGGGGSVYSVTATSPLSSTGGANPNIQFATGYGLPNGSYSYYMYNVSGTYYAINTQGKVDYSGTNAWDVFNKTVNTSDAKVIYLKSGTNILNIPTGIYGQDSGSSSFPPNLTVIGENWNILGVVTPTTKYLCAGRNSIFQKVSIQDAFADDPRYPAGTAKKIGQFINTQPINQVFATWNNIGHIVTGGESGKDTPVQALLNFGAGDGLYIQTQNDVIDPLNTAEGTAIRLDIYGNVTRGLSIFDLSGNTTYNRRLLRIENSSEVFFEIDSQHSLSGTGNAFVCVTSLGVLYRSASACV